MKWNWVGGLGVDLREAREEAIVKNAQLLLRFHTCGEVELGWWVRGGLEGGKRGGGGDTSIIIFKQHSHPFPCFSFPCTLGAHVYRSKLQYARVPRYSVLFLNFV